MSEGTARVVDTSLSEMVTDGPCLSGTLDQLEAGVGAKPMPRQALIRVRADALNLMSKVLTSYVTGVAAGEVGRNGSARAGEAAPIAGRNPTGLLYGRIQSGKTVAMISFCAAAIDNGFRVIVVLTSDFVKLVEQTADRFTALDGPLIRNALQSDNWEADRDHVMKHVAKHGVVFICTKNQQRLTSLVEFLNSIGAADYPALVLDDEADQATLDTTVAARTSGRKNVPLQPSAIHRKTVQDDEGQSIRQTLRHHVFVQVTATPYALLLQNVDNDLRPTFTHLLEPGEAYTGGEAFFGVEHVEEGKPPLVLIDEEEAAQIDDASRDGPPMGLQRALAFFLIAAGAQNILDPASRSTGQNFLCHTSQKTADHARLAMLIRGYLNRLSDDLEAGRLDGEIMMRLHGGYDELLRTLPNAPPFEDVVERIKKRLPRREVPVVNSANSPVEFGRQLNFIVGGNILGRGLTIDNLLVTYYLRRAKVSQMDTVLQHARMFGYRRALMPYTRVFLPDSLGARFHFIHIAEQNLRKQLAASEGRGKVAVETMSTLRATRLNVLDTRNLAAYEAGEQIYPSAASFSRKDLERAPEIEKIVKRLFGGTLREGEFVPVPLAEIMDVLPILPFDEDLANMWDPDMLVRLLDHMSRRYGGQGFLFYRTMSRTKPTLATGALSGPELAAARDLGAPVLCLFRDDGRRLTTKTTGQPYWYPTLVLPSDMVTQLFNTTS
jgi:Z1 domain